MPIIAGIFLAVILLVYAYKKWCFKRSHSFDNIKDAVQVAKANGHVIKAHLLETTFREEEDRNGQAYRVYSSLYVYEINGQKRKKIISTTDILPPQEISLYYTDTPDEVFSWYDVQEK